MSSEPILGLAKAGEMNAGHRIPARLIPVSNCLRASGKYGISNIVIPLAPFVLMTGG